MFLYPSFRSFKSSGALDVYNCQNVTLTDTIFMDNNAISPIADTPFRANAGGIAIGVDEVVPFEGTSVNISILNCSFIRNRAEPPSQNVKSTSQLFVRKIFVGRGGGVGIFIRNNNTVSVIVRDSDFEGNFATSFGGGMYAFMEGNVSNHSISVTRSNFINNTSDGPGGGLDTGYFFLQLQSIL